MYMSVALRFAIYGLLCFAEIEDNTFYPYNWISLE